MAQVLFHLQSFVISILQSRADVVVVFMKPSLFDLLMEVWVREGVEKIVSWLYIDSENRIHYQAPKCDKYFEPITRPSQKILVLTDEGTWYEIYLHF